MPYKDPIKAKEHHKIYNRKWCRTHKEQRKTYNRTSRFNYLDPAYSWGEVEGYDGWTTNVEVHHRREGIGYTRAQLIEQGQYYNCLPSDLICVTKAEHKRIHEEIDKFFGRGNYKQTNNNTNIVKHLEVYL